MLRIPTLSSTKLLSQPAFSRAQRDYGKLVSLGYQNAQYKVSFVKRTDCGYQSAWINRVNQIECFFTSEETLEFFQGLTTSSSQSGRDLHIPHVITELTIEGGNNPLKINTPLLPDEARGLLAIYVKTDGDLLHEHD